MDKDKDQRINECIKYQEKINELTKYYIKEENADKYKTIYKLLENIPNEDKNIIINIDKYINNIYQD
jgi:hypothetical protein